MRNKTKIAIATGLIAVGGYFGADLLVEKEITPEEKEDLVIKAIETKQADALKSGRYASTLSTDSLSSFGVEEKFDGKIQIDEYVAPCGKGYQVVMRKMDGKDEYYKIKAYGCEAKDREILEWTKHIKDFQ